jgi:hypothetical protein
MSKMSRAVVFVALLALVLPAAFAQKKICVYNGDSGIVSSLSSLLGSGYMVVNYNATAFRTLAAKKVGLKADCAAIYVPDTDDLVPSFSASGYQALEDTKSDWVQGVDGPVVLSGTHLGGHGLGTTGTRARPGIVVRGFVDFATSRPGQTGFIMGTDRTYTSSTNKFTTVFDIEIDSKGVCNDDIKILAPSTDASCSSKPQDCLRSYMDRLTQSVAAGGFGVTETDLANQGCSSHNFFKPIRALDPTAPFRVWDTFARDHDETPARDSVITRNSGATSGGTTSVFTNSSGGQIFTPSGTITFTFNIKKIKSSGGATVGVLLGNLPSGKALMVCFKQGAVLVLKNYGKHKFGTSACQ